MHRRLLIVTALVLVTMSTAAWATAQHMARLPATSPFRCLNCHNVQDPTGVAAALNAFGRDFKDNAFRWDRTLAQKHSDGDNCTNGFEIGDQDGDGRLDQGLTGERHNPGELDCALQLTPQAWSALKTLFR